MALRVIQDLLISIWPHQHHGIEQVGFRKFVIAVQFVDKAL